LGRGKSLSGKKVAAIFFFDLIECVLKQLLGNDFLVGPLTFFVKNLCLSSLMNII
jgi:hypothetical protein